MKNFTEKQTEKFIMKAIRFGDELMPSDCADILEKGLSLKVRKKLGMRKLASMIIDMMEAASFCCDRRQALEATVYIVN